MNREMLDLNIILWQTIIDHWENGYYTSDYSPFMREYLAHADGILQRYEEEDEGEEDTQDNDNHSARPASGPSSSNSSFSFGATTSSAPASTNSSFSAPSLRFGATTSSAPTLAGPSSSAPSFNFGTATASAPSSTLAGPSSSAPSFTFSSTTSSAPSTTSFQAASNNDDGEDDDDPTANSDDGEVAFVEANTEEDVLFESRSRLHKKVAGEWKSSRTGILRVYQNKTTKKHRMVLKNEIGIVHFNVAVPRGMKFQKINNGKATYVEFLAKEDAEKLGELVMIQAKPLNRDKLHDLLEELAS